MFEKRYRITLLFNANSVRPAEGVAGLQCDWDIFIEEDFAAVMIIFEIGWATVLLLILMIGR